MAWLIGWNRRKPKLVKGSTAGIQTDYQMKLTVYKSPGTDTIDTIYLGGYVNNDFRDLRFTSSDEITLLPYWIESYTSGVSAIVWVKIDSIPADPFSKFIYVYYDNPVATTTSSVNNTLVFFDDFESGTIDPNKWATQIMYGSMGIRTDKKYGAYSIGSDQGPGQGCCYPSYVIWDQNHYFMKLPDGNNIQYIVSMKTIRWITTAWWSGCFIGFGGGNAIYDFPWDNVWKNYDIILKRTSSSNINYQVAVNGVWGAAANIAITQGTILPFGIQTAHYGPSDNSVYVRSDDFRVRKYASPEPTFGVTGAEEAAPGDVCIKSNPSGASITIDGILQPGKTTAMSGTSCILDNTVIGLLPGINNHSYEINLAGYQPRSGTFTITSGLTTILDIPLTPLPCPIVPKYSGNTITLKATPKDGIGPYYVVFRKNGVDIDQSRLGGLPNPIIGAPENIQITRVYTLDDLDISSALLGTIDFSIYITDSCPTGAKSCTDACTINIGCLAPVCNFTVT